MVKSVAAAATNEKVKVSNQLHIPNDLVFSILSKLSLKSLKRFGCVHKPWTLLFEDPRFMSMYRNNFISSDHSCYDDISLLLFLYVQDRNRLELYSLSGEMFENKVKLDWPPSFQEDGHVFDILGCGGINGIFCLTQDVVSIYWKPAVLWNPATEELKVIPPSPIESLRPDYDASFVFCGFGYDHVRDDYKVIRCVIFFALPDVDPRGCPDPLLEIYSLRSNSWRKLDYDIPEHFYYDHDQPINGVYLDGLSHWWSRSEIDNVEDCLVSFDFSNEVMCTTPMPLEMDDSCDLRFMKRRLVVLNGSIALISNSLGATTFHISILEELGVRESWIKLFIIGPLPCIEHPIGAGKMGDIFFRKEDGELVWFNLSTQMIKELGVKGEQHGCQIGFYKKSLLPIGGRIIN